MATNIYGARHLAQSFQVVRKNTIQIAEDIPESQYEFVPAEGARSVSQLLAHIAVAPTIWLDIHGVKKVKDLNGYDFFGLFDTIRAQEGKPRTKAEMIDFLRSEGERFANFLGGLTDEELAEEVGQGGGQGSKTRLESLMAAKEHEMHHRGQLMIIQRLLGIVPHLTRLMEERMKQMEEARKQPA